MSSRRPSRLAITILVLGLIIAVPAVATALPDKTSPAAPVLLKIPDSWTHKTIQDISWEPVIDDSALAVTYVCRTDSTKPSDRFTACSSPRSRTHIVDGPHTLEVKANDAAGNLSPLAKATWNVDTRAPSAPVLSNKPAAHSPLGTASIGLSAERYAAFTCSFEGGAYSPCTSPKALSGLRDGNHSFAAKATDRAGNTSTAASTSWTVDTLAPVIPVLSGAPAPQTKSKTASIAISAEAGTTLKCSLDGKGYSTCATPKSLSNLPDGAHSLAVKAVDAAGNQSLATTASWNVDTRAPSAPVLSKKPAAHTQDTSASIGISAEDNATLTCSVDGGAYSACTSPQNRTALIDGSYILAVKATDRAGNTSAAATTSWTVDTKAPVAPVLSEIPPSPTTGRSASIVMKSPEAGTTLKCSLDGGTYASCTSPKSSSELIDGSHSLAVKAVDAAGNQSLATTASWTVDGPPAAPVLSNTPAADTQDTSASIGISAADDPDVTFTCSVDGGVYSACTSPQNRTALTDRSYILAVKATDRAGNTSAAATTSWTVDTKPPVKPVLSEIPPSPTTSRSASIVMNSPTVKGTTLKCSLDGGGYSTCTTPKSLSGLIDGDHSLTVKAVDAAGNESPIATASWKVDGPPDAPVLSNTPAAYTQDTRASIGISAEDNATLTCSVDGGAPSPCTTPKSLSGLADGQHRLAVTAKDSTAHESTITKVTWTVDTRAPAAPRILSKPPDYTNHKVAKIYFKTEAKAVVSCSLDSAGYSACTSPWNTLPLADGGHNLSVRATDRAGNTGTAVAAAWNVDTQSPEPPISVLVTSSTGIRYNAVISPSDESNIRCRVMGLAWKKCGSRYTIPLSYLKVGTHKIEAKFVDLAGNESDALQSKPFKVAVIRCPATFNLREGTYLDTFSYWNTSCSTARTVYDRLNRTKLPRSFLPTGKTSKGAQYMDRASGFSCEKQNNGSRQKFTITCDKGTSRMIIVSK